MNRARIVALAVVVLALGGAWLALRPPGGAPATRPGAPASAPTAVENADEGAVEKAVEGTVTFTVAGCADDHLTPEPCSRVYGGGLFSMRAAFDYIGSRAPSPVPVFLGDLTHVGGEIGRNSATFHYSEVVRVCQPAVVAAGPADLSKGVAFARDVLARQGYSVLCANAADASGAACLRGWMLLDAAGKTVLIVASAEAGLQGEVASDGGEVRLLPAPAVVAQALSEGRAEAVRLQRPLAATALLHHGTPDETAALARSVPGFAVAFAARGGDLPEHDPIDAGGTQVFACARALRFAWVVTVEGGRAARWQLLRVGAELYQRGSPVKAQLAEQAIVCRDVAFARNLAREDNRPVHAGGLYVGAQRCAQCHAEQVGPHGASQHGRRPEKYPDESLGQAGCLPCHTTGPFFRGGWKGKTDTSDLGSVSCEACHGPGAAHLEDTAKPYGPRGFDVCRTCHTPDRSPGLDPEALWKRSGHGLK